MNITENWKNELAELIGQDVDQVTALIKAKDLEFSQMLELGALIQDEDLAGIQHMLGITDAPWPPTNSDEEPIEEQDNPFTASKLPTTPTLNKPTTPTTPTTNIPTTPTTPTTPTDKQKDVADLDIGDTISVKDLSGKEIETSVRRRGPNNTLVVIGADGDSVVTADNITRTPELKETTSAGAIATVAMPMGTVHKRTPAKPAPKKKPKKEDVAIRYKKK